MTISFVWNLSLNSVVCFIADGLEEVMYGRLLT